MTRRRTTHKRKSPVRRKTTKRATSRKKRTSHAGKVHIEGVGYISRRTYNAIRNTE